MFHASAVREETSGGALKLANEFIDVLKDPHLKINPGEMQALLKQAVQRFNALPARTSAAFAGRWKSLVKFMSSSIRLAEAEWCPG